MAGGNQQLTMLATLTFDHIGCADWKSLRQTVLATISMKSSR
jgi:hypothetical protein